MHDWHKFQRVKHALGILGLHTPLFRCWCPERCAWGQKEGCRQEWNSCPHIIGLSKTLSSSLSSFGLSVDLHRKKSEAEKMAAEKIWTLRKMSSGLSKSHLLPSQIPTYFFFLQVNMIEVIDLTDFKSREKYPASDLLGGIGGPLVECYMSRWVFPEQGQL